MAKVQLTNQQLFNFYNEITAIEQGSILFYFLNGKIREFHNSNRIRIQTMLDRYNSMMADHYVIEDGQIKMQKPLVDSSEVAIGDGTPKPMLTGKTTQEEYEKLRTDFLLSTTTIEV